MGNSESLSPSQVEKIERSFSAQSLMATLGAQLSRVSKGEIEITCPILEGSQQQHGFAHAGLTFSIGDSAAGYAALSIMPEEAEVLTSEMKIHLLAPGRGDVLVARGKVIKPGRRLVIAQADIFGVTEGQETHVATMLGTLVPILPK